MEEGSGRAVMGGAWEKRNESSLYMVSCSEKPCFLPLNNYNCFVFIFNLVAITCCGVRPCMIQSL